MSPKVHPRWLEWIAPELAAPAFHALIDRVKKASETTTVYPPPAHRYTALEQDPAETRVVILGQDPYHGPNQAHGLSFSVLPGVPVPPSLKNIYQEIEKEGLGVAAGRDGYLKPWADQGVLLLNNVLTVEAGRPGSHRGWGWEGFTDAMVRELNARCDGLVFLLWGRDAATKAAGVDASRHLVLKSPHPSPFSAHSGFFGNGHFTKANAYLKSRGHAPINW